MGEQKAVGIDASIRLVDAAPVSGSAEYVRLYDLISVAARFPATPTRDDLETFFHSRTATLSGTRNLPGTSSPAIDALVGAAGAAKDRESLTIAMRALEPGLACTARLDSSWFLANHRSAYWTCSAFPNENPISDFPVEALWWVDKTRRQKLAKPDMTVRAGLAG